MSTDPGAPAPPRTAGPSDRTAFGIDLLAVLVFVVIGRRSHDEGSVLLGTLGTA